MKLVLDKHSPEKNRQEGKEASNVIRQELADARAVFQGAKKIAHIKPKALVHDGLRAYNEAYQKEFYTLKNPRTMNVRSVSVRHQGLNSKVERLNGSVRSSPADYHEDRSPVKLSELGFEFCYTVGSVAPVRCSTTVAC